MPTSITYKPVPPDELTRAFDAELTRLLALSLSPEDELIARRYYSDKERAGMDESAFCGPHKSFPVQNESDFKNAVHLIGHADNPDAVKACLKRKAKANGWSLPDAWTSEKDDGSDRATAPVVIRADGNHDPMTGTHSHAHPAFGSQGDDEQHSHEHSHSADADHHHSHNASRAMMPTPDSPRMYIPFIDIRRNDPNRWEVEGVATSEELDSFGTIFSYDGSKKAFQRWMERTANVREMHDKKAVGKGIEVRFDDDARKIYLRTRVSKGAPDTWTKIQEGVLDGYSVGAINPVWDTIERGGKKYPYLVSYDLAETSLVDNASNPDGQGLAICRADGLTDLVDTSEPEPAAHSIPVASSPAGASVSSSPSLSTVGGTAVERVGARVGQGTRSAMHENMGHTLQALKGQAKNCNCEGCQAVSKFLDPDDDGDIDAFGGLYGDSDGDAATLADADRAVEPAVTQATLDALTAHLDRVFAPYMQRSSAVIARMAGIPEPESLSPELIRSAVSAELIPTLTELTALKDTVNAALERLSSAMNQSEVRSLLSEVKETVTRIAEQPAPGGPVLNGGYPVDKRLANQPPVQPAQQDSRALWDWAHKQGLLDTPDKQMRAAAGSVIPVSMRQP